MEIKLRNIYVSERLSKKRMAFQASLYIDRYKVGLVNNDGMGGEAILKAANEIGRALIGEAKTWCKQLAPIVYNDTVVDGMPLTIPMDLDIYIHNLLIAWLKVRGLDKFRRKMEKDMQMGVLFGIPDKTYRILSYKMPLGYMMKFAKGIERLKIDIHKLVIPLLEEGEKILNTNIPTGVIKVLDIRDRMITGPIVCENSNV